MNVVGGGPRMSLDEQTCASKVGHLMKQYRPPKSKTKEICHLVNTENELEAKKSWTYETRASKGSKSW